MSYKIVSHIAFDKEFKRLAKKYRSLKNDYIALLNELQHNPTTGTLIAPGIRKVRMAITAKGKGKSHGARIITHFIDSLHTGEDEVSIFANVEDGVITLLIIYDKAERASISVLEIEALLKQNGLL